MRFLLDENVGKEVQRFLVQQGHQASRIRELNPGIPDYQVLDLSFANNSVLVTSDKDYGELIYKLKLPHSGVILLRLENELSENKVAALREVLSEHPDPRGKFLVVTEKNGIFRVKLAK